MADIRQRKADHLDLCATDAVAFRQQTTLLECVRLVHQALPELNAADLELGIELLGKKLRAPIVIAGMTGGVDEAAKVNEALATIAERRGYGFGLGSQRAMLQSPETAWTYKVRQWAPTTLVLGNLGVVLARDCATKDVAGLVSDVGADALCLHMNPAMETVQAEGDRDFRGCAETFARLARELPVPVVAKETGCGISRRAATVLHEAGVGTVDVSGAGGTSWVGVEALRAEGDQRRLGELLWDWGIPTAASVHLAAKRGLDVIATGGISNGLDAARAIVLGAQAVGMARPVYQAFVEGGIEGAETFLMGVERELRAVMLLTGSGTVHELRRAARVITGELRRWT